MPINVRLYRQIAQISRHITPKAIQIPSEDEASADSRHFYSLTRIEHIVYVIGGANRIQNKDVCL